MSKLKSPYYKGQGILDMLDSDCPGSITEALPDIVSKEYISGLYEDLGDWEDILFYDQEVNDWQLVKSDKQQIAALKDLIILAKQKLKMQENRICKSSNIRCAQNTYGREDMAA